jgi:hypothetical protein
LLWEQVAVVGEVLAQEVAGQAIPLAVEVMVVVIQDLIVAVQGRLARPYT